MAPSSRTKLLWFMSIGRVLLLMSFVALVSAWASELFDRPVFGLTQQHLFFDAIALAVLGIGCLLDSMLHARYL